MRTDCIKHLISSASELGQYTMLFMNKFAILFIKTDVNDSGTNGDPFHWPTWIN